MPRRIESDHKDFRDVYSNRIRKALKKYINNGTIFRARPDGTRVPITIPKIDIPIIVHGSNDKGVGRGEGKPGDIIQKGKKGKGKGDKAGQEEQDGITISLDLEDVLKFLQDELQLPELKPKPNETLEEEEIKYNSISLVGPNSLLHKRRMMLQALKRLSSTGEYNKLHYIPGFADPVKLITPINNDRRFRQYTITKKPSSNAVIFFARDGSGSMDQYKCDIISDMAWWMDIWIRSFYKRVERCYIWHDTVASEVDEHKFYRYRYGGGTTCSSALKLIGKQFDSRFPPDKWNFYIFYFTDGENQYTDNQVFLDVIKQQFPPETVNFFGLTQVLAGSYQSSLKEFVDNAKGLENVRTTSVEPSTPAASSAGMWGYNPQTMSDEDRDMQIKRAIIDLLGTGAPTKAAKEVAVD